MSVKKFPPYHLFISGVIGGLILIIFILTISSGTNTDIANQRITDGNLASFTNVTPEQYPSSPVRGNQSAPISIFEFSCFTCPYSALIQAELKAVLDNYPDKVKIIWKDTLLEQTPESWPAHRAGRCAKSQNKFWEYADELWLNQDNLTNDNFIAIAKKLSLDTDTFKQCLETNQVDDDIRRDLDEATTIGIIGTPTLIIGDQTLTGVYSADDIAMIIESQL